MEKKKKESIVKENNKILKTIEEYNNNGKRTIVIISDAYYPAVDGVIKVFENQANILKQKNNVVLCVPKHKNKVYSDCDYLVIGVNSIPASTVGYDCAFPNLDAFFNKAMRKLRIDIIHFHSPFGLGSYAVNLAKRKKVPVIGTFHSLYKQDFYRVTKNNYLSQLLTNIIISPFNKSTLVTTMNNFAANELRNYGYKGDIKLLPNATDFKPIEDIDDEIALLKNKYNISNDEIIFSFLGRIIKEKQIFFLINVLKILKERGLKFKMLFIGKGLDEDKLKKKIREYELSNEVIMVGLVKDIKTKSALLKMSKLFLFPSTYDTDGIVKIEAAAMNVPSLCIAGTGAASTIIDNENGYISELDEETYANKIFSILDNKEQLEKVSKKAYNDLYVTWEDVVSKLENIYDEQIENYKNKKIKKKKA